MSNQRVPASIYATASRLCGVLIVASLALASRASAQEQEKTLTERAKEYWEKVITRMESGAKSAGDEYHKLKAEAATATGPARAKMAAELEVAETKWAAAREKLTTSLERHAHSVHEDLKSLEEKAATATGPARAKMAAEAESLRKHWEHVSEKVGAALSSSMKATRDEYTHLKDEAGKGTEETRAKLRPRMDRLKTEWSTHREKLTNYLKEDLRRTEDDLHKVENATSETAKAAREKLTKKLNDLRGKSDSLASEKFADEPQ